jgi:hypothetical protein
MNQKIRGVSSWVVLVTFSLNLTAGRAGAVDMTGAMNQLVDQVKTMVFNPPSHQLALQDPMAQLDQDMKKCEMADGKRAIFEGLEQFNVTDRAANVASNLLTGKKGDKRNVQGLLLNATIDKPAEFTPSKFRKEYCDSKFPDAGTEVPACPAKVGDEEKPDTTALRTYHDAVETRIKEVNNHKAFLEWKAKNCADRDLKALEAEIEIYRCKENAMKKAVTYASDLLQNSLKLNADEFRKGQLFVAEVGQQIKEVDEILGPEDSALANAEGESGNQFKGLFGIQRALTQQMTEMNTKEAQFKTDIEDIQNKTSANDQTLESDRMGEVTKCMQSGKGVSISGGRALTCFVPKTEADGRRVYNRQACGPMEWLKSQVSQSAFITSRGVMRDQRRTEESESYGAEFESLQTAILRDLGAMDDKGEDGGKLVTRETNWNDIARKHSAAMQELSAKTGVNINQQLNAIAGSCFTEADGWRKQQKRSMSSRYNKQKAEITKAKDKVNAELRNSLAALNKSYGDAMSVLNLKVANINRTSCTQNDPEAMQKCFVDLKQGVTDLLEGNGGTVSVPKRALSGGTQPAPYALAPVPLVCKGVNGCVTELKRIRIEKKDQLVNSQKVLVKFVNDTNSMVKTQLSTFATSLSRLQAQMKTQFSNLNAKLAKMGASPVKAPGSMEAETLKQMQPKKEGEIEGPYEQPTSMAKVLSGMVQPEGLMEFSEEGLNAVRESAKAQADKKKEELTKLAAEFKDSSKELKSEQKECLASNSEKVNNLDCTTYDPIWKGNCVDQYYPAPPPGFTAGAGVVLASAGREKLNLSTGCQKLKVVRAMCAAEKNGGGGKTEKFQKAVQEYQDASSAF